jgi:hypothetical protein
MRSLAILALLCLVACNPTVSAGPQPSADAASPEFLTCPGRPGIQYRPGFENTTCRDR